MRSATDHQSLPFPPTDLLRGASLLIDFDGTLVDLVDRPDDVFADAPLRQLLSRLADRGEGGVAIVSGRSIAQLDKMLGPIAHAIGLSGSHGSELRSRGVSLQPERPAALDVAAERFQDFATRHPGVLVEIKSFGTALHFRQAPEVEAKARAFAADIGTLLGLALQPGNMMVELRVPGSDKGVAVRRLMEAPPMAGTRPIFIGDDLTDEPGFVAAKDLGGVGILVGKRRSTEAGYGLPDTAAVRTWLESALA